jgi:hypothetical protein
MPTRAGEEGENPWDGVLFMTDLVDSTGGAQGCLLIMPTDMALPLLIVVYIRGIV